MSTNCAAPSVFPRLSDRVNVRRFIGPDPPLSDIAINYDGQIRVSLTKRVVLKRTARFTHRVRRRDVNPAAAQNADTDDVPRVRCRTDANVDFT
jgi:hypothetical protein